jgi:photosystem II stability/assembly factor-like uncharacterized protein
MKTSYFRLLFSGFLLCTCVLASQFAQAQTNVPFSYPADYISNITDVHVDNTGTGYLGGSCGVLRKTTNDGQSWAVSNSPTNDDIEAISCPPGGCSTALLATDNELYRLSNGNWTNVTYPGYDEGGNLHWLTNSLVVHEAGSSGLWRSTNGGTSWARVVYGENKSSELFFADANIGYLFANSKLLKTTDGGASFTETGYTHPNSPYYLAWLDADTGWTFDRDRKFWKTTDGGINWTILNDEQQLSTLNWFVPITADHLVATQGITKAESTDGGVTWTRGSYGVSSVNGTGSKYHRSGSAFFVPAAGNQMLYSPANFTDWVDQDESTIGDRISDIAFATNEVGYAIGGVKLFKTSNTGADWSAETIGSSLRELGILPSGDPVLMTDSDVWVSRDQGNTFTDLFAAGTVPSISDNPDIMITKPGGDIYFFGPNSSYLSTDNGATFTRTAHDLSYFATAIFFVDDEYGYVVDRNRKFATTTDGGQTWQVGANVPNSPEALFFTSRTKGWMSSANRRYETIDGGANWTNPTDGAGGYDPIRRSEDGAIYAARWDANTLVRSTDEGDTWTELAGHCFGYRSLALTPNERYAFVSGEGFIVRHDLDELVSSTRRESRAAALNLRAYPNPSNGQFSLEVPMTFEPTSLSIFDMSGREVMALTVPAGREKVQLDLGHLSGGVYVARWATANGKMGRVRLVKR